MIKMDSYKAYTPTDQAEKIYGAGSLEPPKFFPTYYEWLANQGQRIFASAGAANAQNTIYAVPDGYNFYLCFFSLTAMIYGTDGVNGTYGAGYIRIGLSTAYKNFAMVNVSSTDDKAPETGVGTAENSNAICSNLTIPIKINEGESLFIASDIGFLTAFACIQGFLVPKSSIPQI